LTNKIASPFSTNYTVERVKNESCIPLTNLSKSINGIGLIKINGKDLHYQSLGEAGEKPIVFVHGLGGTLELWKPLINASSLATTHSLHLFDLEGHGLSPTSPLSELSISSFADDIKGVFQHAGISSGAILVAHSMGCLAAITFVLANPGLVEKLILVGPPPSPLPEAASTGSYQRATLARTKGMSAVVDAVVGAGTSEHSKKNNHVAVAAARLSLLGQDPEGYAKACTALAGATTAIDVAGIHAETLIITGSEDKVSPPALCEKYAGSIPKSHGPIILENVGHWHLFEDVTGVADAVRGFL
jgi:pimeloyl-ACP methyl ester carboxylesterase